MTSSRKKQIVARSVLFLFVLVSIAVYVVCWILTPAVAIAFSTTIAIIGLGILFFWAIDNA